MSPLLVTGDFERENTFARGEPPNASHSRHFREYRQGQQTPFKEVVREVHRWNDAAEIRRDLRGSKEAEVDAHEMSHPARKAHVKSSKAFGNVREWNTSWNRAIDRHLVTSNRPPNTGKSEKNHSHRQWGRVVAAPMPDSVRTYISLNMCTTEGNVVEVHDEQNSEALPSLEPP